MINQNLFTVSLIVFKLIIYIMICTSVKVNLISVHILLKVFIVILNEMYISKSKFDFSAYPPESVYCNTENKQKKWINER